jgi:hypothetical protein
VPSIMNQIAFMEVNLNRTLCPFFLSNIQDSQRHADGCHILDSVTLAHFIWDSRIGTLLVACVLSLGNEQPERSFKQWNGVCHLL